ncbi:peptidase M56 BlaR1 [Fibrisoma montanum]|uniref:Peptidase M56 BlaR1 n=1 Tax=Fibrisoma montanum TaxID=2305895 RepID=A0A418MEF6_9BACT|nr:M56 family metallopeptidase [Fibrisoma montanum]RIV25171.1 peptidase M56 BlaR1 [Fibrisoma montanum]
MNRFLFDLPLSPEFIQALSWTLLHSLWQGLVLAILTGLVLLTLRKARPALRYHVLLALLGLFMAVSAVTFWLEYPQTADTIVQYAEQPGTEISSRQAGKTDLWPDRERQITHLMDFGSRHAPLIVAVWFVVFLLKTLKAGMGLYSIHWLRHHGTRPVSREWAERVTELARRLKLRQAVLFAESERVTVPLVVGFLRPLILVPAGFLTQLPYQQVEAILLHELAHIHRKDYLVNLFQSLAEHIFFFNPAVLWLSYLLRQEREHCCDELAIGVTQNRKSFVEALVQFQEYKLMQPVHTLAFAGRRNHLLDRIKRIMYNNNKPLEAVEKVFVSTSLLAITLLSVAFSPTSPSAAPQPKAPSLPVRQTVVISSPSPVAPTAAIVTPPATPIVTPKAAKAASVVTPPAVADTIQPGTKKKQVGKALSTYHMSFNGKRYEIVEQDGKITGLTIDGTVIAEDKIESYRSELEPVMAQVREHQKQAELHRAYAEEHRREAEEHRRQAEVQRAEAQAQRVTARRDAEEMRTQAEKNRKEAQAMRASQEQYRAQADAARRQADEARQMAQVRRREADEHRAKAEAHRAEYEKMQNGLITDLIQEGVIQSKENMSYRLNEDELVVNGQKQSDALHQKLKNKYLKESKGELFHNWQGKSGIMYSR